MSDDKKSRAGSVAFSNSKIGDVFSGFAGKFTSNIEEARKREVLNAEAEGFQVSMKASPATLWQDSFAQFRGCVEQWLEGAFLSVAEMQANMRKRLLVGYESEALFFINVAILNQKGNLLKKDVAEYFRRKVGQFNSENGDTLILEFSSGKMLVDKTKDLLRQNNLLPKDFLMVDGVLRWKISKEGRNSFNSLMLFNHEDFRDYALNLTGEARDIICDFESLRLDIIQLNTALRSVYQQGLDYVISLNGFYDFEEEMTW